MNILFDDVSIKVNMTAVIVKQWW